MNRSLIAISILIITQTSIAEQPNQTTITGDDYLGIIGQEVVIKFKDKTCTVTTKGISGKKNEAPKEFTLNFNCGNKTQVLWDINKPNKDDFSFDDAPFEVIWLEIKMMMAKLISR